MKITDEQRSMIATAFVAAFDSGTLRGKDERLTTRSLCCGPDATFACARIVGERHAEKLRNYFYESLACAGSDEQHYLDKISALETL